MSKPNINLKYREQDGMMLPDLQISNSSEADQPLGRYGRMALEYLRENHPERFTTLKMDGSLMEIMHRVQDEATEKIEALIAARVAAKKAKNFPEADRIRSELTAAGIVLEDGPQGTIKIALKYDPVNKVNSIKKLIRVSTPGLRKYTGFKDMPRVLNGLGIAIISTSKGVMTNKQAREEKVGGEVLCYVY